MTAAEPRLATTFVIHQGDALSVLRTLEIESFDACFCDPPYGLGEKRNSRSASPRRSCREERRKSGFMGLLWDAETPDVEVWVAVLQALKPGAYLLAFGGTRTHHRLTCAIEDAGFEIRDVLIWLHGQGFPKSFNSEAGGTALKPAWEPIILARKPIAGTLEENFARWGTGFLNIEASRIKTGDALNGGGTKIMRLHGGNGRPSHEKSRGKGGTNFAALPGPRGGDPSGRWPANVILDHSSAALLDEQSGTLTSGANPTRRQSDKFRNTYQPYAGAECAPVRGADSGGASRFFYCAKASVSERGEGNTHPTVKPLKLCEYLARLILPLAEDSRRILIPYSGSGSEMLGARAAGWRDIVGIEADSAYAAMARKRFDALESEEVPA